MPETTARDVAVFMLTELERRRELDQDTAVYQIQKKFGTDFVYANANGGLSIGKNVLKEFRKITPDVVWARGERCWRKRNQYDEGNARQQD